MNIYKLKSMITTIDLPIKEKVIASLTLQLYLEHLLIKKEQGLLINDEEILTIINDQQEFEKTMLKNAIKSSLVSGEIKLLANHVLQIQQKNIEKIRDLELDQKLNSHR